jgi:hypothetical protein
MDLIPGGLGKIGNARGGRIDVVVPRRIFIVATGRIVNFYRLDWYHIEVRSSERFFRR